MAAIQKLLRNQLLLHVTSLPHDADVEGNIIRHNINLPRVVVTAFIFSELCGGGGGAAPPVVEDQNMPGLNRVNKGCTMFVND